MKLMVQHDSLYLIKLTNEERNGMTGRAYIRKRLKEQFAGIKIDQIKISRYGDMLPNWFEVQFNKKTADCEILLRCCYHDTYI